MEKGFEKLGPSQEELKDVVGQVLSLLDRKDELESFTSRGSIGKPQKGEGESFFIMSGMRGGAAIIALQKTEDGYFGYLSGGVGEDLPLVRVADQDAARATFEKARKLIS
jgi:hypothetical protein